MKEYPTMSSKFFGDTDNAVVSNSAPLIGLGTYTAVVDTIRAGVSGKRKKFVAIDLYIESAGAGSVSIKDTIVTYLLCEDEWGYWMGDMKAFVAALAEKPLQGVTSAMMDAAIGEAQPYMGKKLHVQVVQVTSRKSGKPFSKVHVRLAQ